MMSLCGERFVSSLGRSYTTSFPVSGKHYDQVYPASILTLTEASGISHDLGTRHRAAIGVSETTDAIVLIVSEETGIISMAKGGKLTRHLDAKSLRTILEGIYVRKPHQRLLSMLVRRKGKDGAK